MEQVKTVMHSEPFLRWWLIGVWSMQKRKI